MRYMLRRKLFSLGGDLTIKDENEQDRFLVRGKIFSLGHHLTFEDLQGNELATIQQKMLSFQPTYEITHGGLEMAEVHKQLTLFTERFTVDIPGTDDLEVQGDIWNHEYEFLRDGQVVAAVSQQWFSIADTYGVEVMAGIDDVLILACAVVIDEVNEDREHH
ncbi:MAG: LURP-one-related/scramblase family protein [Ktedonobacterales bacterium]